MSTRNLPIDLSFAWKDEQTDRMVLRFNDLSLNKQKRLATRIKNGSGIRTLRTRTTVTPQKIQEVLTEMNPIIFSELLIGFSCYTPFSTHNIRTLSGYRFKRTVSIIYRVLCIKKQISKNDLIDIAYFSSDDWTGSRLKVEESLNSQREDTHYNKLDTHIPDLNVIRNARERL